MGNTRTGEYSRVAAWIVATWIPLAGLALPDAAAGQAPVSGGYYEHTLQAVAVGSGIELVDASKLRLDLDAGTGAVRFTGNLNALAYHGRLERDIRPYLPDAVVSELEAAGFSTTQTLPASRVWLDNAYLSWTAGSFRVRAGKQQLSWGAGYSYNPTDLFHRKDALDPTYEKEGVATLRADVRWGVGGQLSVIAAPRNTTEASGYAVRVGTHLAAIGYDAAITVHQVEDTVRLDPTSLTPLPQRRRALGLELSGALLGAGVWVEGNYSRMADEEDFARIVAGADYTFNDGTYVMTETLYNGRAKADAPYPTIDWVESLLSGEPVGRWWTLAGVRRDLAALTALELYVFASPDRSFVFNPRVQTSIAQNADITVFGGVTFGRDDGAFAPGLRVLVARGTVYF